MQQQHHVTPPHRTLSTAAFTPHTPLLLLMRVCSAVVTVFALALYLTGLLTYAPLAYAVCDAPVVCSSVQLSTASVHTLTGAGIPVALYITLGLLVNLGASLIWFLIAAVLFWRRSNVPIVLLIATQLVTQGATSTVEVLIDRHTVWATPATALFALNNILLFYGFALFPTGRFVPRWFGWLGLVWAGLMAATLAPGPLAQLGNSYWAFLAMLLAIIGAQAYRYWQVSSPIERQQAKWVVLAIAATTATQLLLVPPTLFVPALQSNASLYQLLIGLVQPIFVLFGPIALAFALLRYRLFDIDLIIRRTLIYGSLTAILAAVYFAVVVTAQLLGDRFTGQSSPPPWLIVTTTLGIAALFTPLRRRVQRVIDHRFFRSRYDATRTVEAFASTLRTELDLRDLSAHLVDVVQQTMQPAHVSLWLRVPNGARPRSEDART